MTADGAPKKTKAGDFTDEQGTQGDGTVVSTKTKESVVALSRDEIVPLIQIVKGALNGLVIALEDQPITLGRSTDCELCLPDASCSRRHAEIYKNKNSQVIIRDLNSTNGTRVNGKKIFQETVLNANDRVQLGEDTVFKITFVPAEEAKLQIDVYKKATMDSLTCAYNRRYFLEHLEREISFIKRGPKKEGIALILFDVDFFKKINDSFGHLAGDEVLRDLSRRVRHILRKEDVFARIGGEEFAVVTRAESLQGVESLCERLREAMSQKPAVWEHTIIPFTISLGAALLTSGTDLTVEQLIEYADKNLYRSKSSGRNKTTSTLLGS